MTERVRVEQPPGQRPQAVKTARPHERARLEHERAVLEAARHPGVISVLGWRELEDGAAEMATDFVGSRSLAGAARLTPEQVAALGASVATTLADLHSLGITHGAIDESHVLLDREGRPVLCGFAAASRHGVGPPDGGAVVTPSDDVEALGALLTRLLSADTESDPIPERRWAFVRTRRRATWLRRLLLSLADQATYPTAHRRPSAAALARSLSDTVPPGSADCRAELGRNDSSVNSNRSGEPSAMADQSPGDGPARGRWLPVTAVAGLLLVGGGALTWLRPGAGAEPDVNEALVEAAESPSIQSRDTAGGPTTAAEGSTIHAMPLGPSPTVVFEGRRFAVGEPGDVAVVGDWDCDGLGTVALVRPATGEVFVFDAWTDDPTSVTATTIVESGTTAEARPDASGCHTLVVSTDGGTIHEIDLIGHGPP